MLVETDLGIVSVPLVNCPVCGLPHVPAVGGTAGTSGCVKALKTQIAALTTERAAAIEQLHIQQKCSETVGQGRDAFRLALCEVRRYWWPSFEGLSPQTKVAMSAAREWEHAALQAAQAARKESDHAY